MEANNSIQYLKWYGQIVVVVLAILLIIPVLIREGINWWFWNVSSAIHSKSEDSGRWLEEKMDALRTYFLDPNKPQPEQDDSDI